MPGSDYSLLFTFTHFSKHKKERHYIQSNVRKEAKFLADVFLNVVHCNPLAYISLHRKLDFLMILTLLRKNMDPQAGSAF